MQQMFYLKLCTDFYDCDNDEPAREMTISIESKWKRDRKTDTTIDIAIEGENEMLKW